MLNLAGYLSLRREALGKIDEKKRQKKEALLDSAYQLFTEKGVEETSVSEIVGNAHLAKGTFYLYFKDKYQVRDLLIARQAHLLFVRAGEQLQESFLIKEARKSLEECVIFIVDNILDYLNENPVLLRFISKNWSWAIFSDIRLEEMENQKTMDFFNVLIEQSDKKYRQKELMIYMIVELVNATCYNVILHHSPVGLDELKKDLYVTIRNLIRQFECN